MNITRVEPITIKIDRVKNCSKFQPRGYSRNGIRAKINPFDQFEEPIKTIHIRNR